MEPGRIKKTRNRSTIVCTNCRRKKIKCDKTQPCSNCIKLNSTETCTYSVHQSQVLTSSGSESDGNNIKLLKSQVDDLVSQISAMKKIITNGGNFTIPESPKPKLPYIFDMKLPDLNKTFIITKPSRTTCFSFLVGKPLINADGFMLFSFCGFRQLLDRERSVWKQKNKKALKKENNEFLLSKKINYDEVLDVVDKIIVENYEAFVERLQYFTTNLNKLLYSGFIPMDIVMIQFQSFFQRSKEKIIFNPPKKDYNYSSLSLVVSLVNLSCTFTKYEEPIFFKHPLDISTSELCKVSDKFLGISNYKRKVNLLSLYALITLRSCKFIYGNSESAGMDDENAFPMFQECLDICYILGLHLSPDKVTKIQMPKKTDDVEFFYANMVSFTSQKLLWNYMQRLDAWYSISIGTPLLIDYEFCNKYYDLPGEEFRGEYVIQLRKISKIMNGNKRICLNDLLTSVDDLFEFCSRLISAEKFEKMYTVSENLWSEFAIKQQILTIIWNLCIFIMTNLSEPTISTHFTIDELQRHENQDLIKKTTSNLRAKCFVLYISVFKVLKKMCRNIKFTTTRKLLLYTRKYFIRWFGVPSFNMVETLASHELAKDDELLPNILELDIYQMEQYLFSPAQESPINFYCLGKLDVSSIVTFITEIYELIVKIPIFSTTYDFFVKAKVCLITFYFFTAVMKTDVPQGKGINQKLIEIGKKSREKLEQKMNVGVLDEKLPLCDKKDNHSRLENPSLGSILNISYGDNSNNEIEDVFSSLMEDQEMIDLFQELDNFVYDYSNAPEWVDSTDIKTGQ